MTELPNICPPDKFAALMADYRFLPHALVLAAESVQNSGLVTTRAHLTTLSREKGNFARELSVN
jgi:hypothetical protein